MELHSKYVPGSSESIFDVDQRLSQMTHIVPILQEEFHSEIGAGPTLEHTESLKMHVFS